MGAQQTLALRELEIVAMRANKALAEGSPVRSAHLASAPVPRNAIDVLKKEYLRIVAPARSRSQLAVRRQSVATLFSYVVDHDVGFAPNPYSGYCTLVHCKFGGVNGRRSIVESADAGAWILGSGGKNKDSAGNGKLIYLMRVDETPTFQQFLFDARFRGRSDCEDFGSGNIRALISRHFFYFGRNAVDISVLPSDLALGLLKKGAGFRRDFPSEKVTRLAKWFEQNYKPGMRGEPCG